MERPDCGRSADCAQRTCEEVQLRFERHRRRFEKATEIQQAEVCDAPAQKADGVTEGKDREINTKTVSRTLRPRPFLFSLTLILQT